VGSAAGWYGGEVAGGAVGAAIGAGLGSVALPLFGTVGGEVIGEKLGEFIGGMAGDAAGSAIASKLYTSLTGYRPPKESKIQELGEDLGSTILNTAGYYAAGPLAGAIGEIGGEMTLGAGSKLAPEGVKLAVDGVDAIARVTGMAAGTVAGTRFGGYVSRRVGGVAARMAATAAGAADEASDLFEKRGNIMPKVLRNDLDDSRTLKTAPAVNRFRQLLVQADTTERAKAAALARFRPGASMLRQQPGEPYEVFQQRLVQQAAEQQPASFIPGGNRAAPKLFPKAPGSTAPV
jgi:hypothetical protein